LTLHRGTRFLFGSKGSAMPPAQLSMIEPGQWVRHPDRPDWGVGQVQSAIGDRVTVNFEHAGKQLMNIRVVALQPDEEPSPK
jgi:hypothetical protein